MLLYKLQIVFLNHKKNLDIMRLDAKIEINKNTISFAKIIYTFQVEKKSNVYLTNYNIC
jgi:hypothetical protein